ncbi:MAG: hypothetical protein SGJ20_06840 [Planctomycetota bacterium]|nr:hypothetical protein [Planctomycetota bacterium]
MSYFVHPHRFPKNVDGPFYTLGTLYPPSDDPILTPGWHGNCMACEAPEGEAPDLLAPLTNGGNVDTYFVRQPETPDEVNRAVRAAKICCTSALRYGGQDREIIKALGNNPEFCDYVYDQHGVLHLTIDSNGNPYPFAQEMFAKGRAFLLVRRQSTARPWWKFWA